jgi:histidine decarboxylase
MRNSVSPEAPAPQVSALQQRDLNLYEGLDNSKRQDILQRLNEQVAARRRKFFGDRIGQRIDYQSDLAPFLNCNLVYLGDPFEDSSVTPNTRLVEKAVLEYYARLWHAKPRSGSPLDKDAYWGYVSTMGSSEGNLYALCIARDYLSGKTLTAEADGDSEPGQMWVQDTPPTGNSNFYSPIAFYSEDTHYSVTKALRMLGIPTFYEVGTECYPHANPLSPGARWPKEVPSQDGATGPGAIDVENLVTLIEFFASMGHPILINLNYCTAFKGAYDNAEEISARIRPILRKYGLDRRRVCYGRDENGRELVDERTGYWINIDGALSAMYAPFLHKAAQQRLVEERDSNGEPIRLPKFDFQIPEICSIVTSGHKYTGAPWPCGIVMTRRSFHMTPPNQPDASNSGDTLFGGSRNAFGPLALWNFLAQYSQQEQTHMIAEFLKLAQETQDEIQALEADWDVHRSPWSLTIWFKKPPQEILDEFWLPTVKLREDQAVAEYVHLPITAQHLTRERITDLVERMTHAAPALCVAWCSGTWWASRSGATGRRGNGGVRWGTRPPSGWRGLGTIARRAVRSPRCWPCVRVSCGPAGRRSPSRWPAVPAGLMPASGPIRACLERPATVPLRSAGPPIRPVISGGSGCGWRWSSTRAEG